MPRKFLLLIASTLVAVLLAEGGTRVLLRARGSPYTAAGAERELDELLSLMTTVCPETPAESVGGEEEEEGLHYVVHPYTAFTLGANLEVQETAVRHFRAEQGPGDFDVFVLGGSVASIFCGKKGAFEWLQTRLEADPRLAGRRVNLFRLAIPGYKQPQQLTTLAYMLSRGCRPELVINLDGLNEVRQGVRNANLGVQPTWPSIGHWASVTGTGGLDAAGVELLVDVGVDQRAARAQVGRARRFGLMHSALLGRLVLSRLRSTRDDWHEAQQRFVAHVVEGRNEARSRPFGIEAEATGALEESVACWYESSLAMHDLCTPLGIRYVHLLQPTLHDEGSKPLTEEEQRKGLGEGGYDERVKQGYLLLREAGARLAAKGVAAHDLSRAFQGVEQTLYYDECHFNQAGNQLLAERLLELIDGML